MKWSGKARLSISIHRPLFLAKSNAEAIHFTGIFGSGMSALAQYLRFQGITVSGFRSFSYK